jgi:SOS response regulatory protein OraA/RecX
MPKYNLTGRIMLKGISTGTIKATMTADSPEEAQEKFKHVLRQKAEQVVDSCQEQNPFQEATDILRDMFSNLNTEGK